MLVCSMSYLCRLLFHWKCHNVKPVYRDSMTSAAESVILRRSPFLSPLRVEDIFDEVDKIPPDLPFLELSTLHCRLEKQVRSTVTLAQ
uniref:Uncharacterized protein n=1 Tax=Steinernema glaseri TaxID=37863 RepID=A0A1I7Y115_9BILA